MRLVATILAVAVVLAGCVGATQGPAGAEGPVAAEAAAPAPLGLAGADCVEGGGHSVHPRSLWEKGIARVVPEPWVPADVLEDVGPQVMYSEVPDPERPLPEKGNTMGNYHATMWCKSWTMAGETKPDLFLGFVGMKVERPAFDEDVRATHHYLVTVVATNDKALLESLRAGGIAAMDASAQREALPDGTLRIRMWTDGNGEYDSLFKPKPHGEMRATHVRLWFQSEPDGDGHGHGHDDGPHRSGAFRPVALDLVATGGTHAVAEAQGYFSHGGTDHHAPLPGAYGHTAALLYEGFDRVVGWGPRPDVTLETAYVH